MWNDLSKASLDDIMAWANDQPWCRAMADCQQDSEWHAEGDVWTHTKMVCAQLPKLAEWPTLTPHERIVLTFTALFHDSAKPLTSQVDPATGRVTSPKHAIQANLGRLNESFKLPCIPELIERKVSGTEKGRLKQADLGVHQREYERLRAELEQAYQDSKLPEAPSGTAALDELLVRIRLGKTSG